MGFDELGLRKAECIRSQMLWLRENRLLLVECQTRFTITNEFNEDGATIRRQQRIVLFINIILDDIFFSSKDRNYVKAIIFRLIKVYRY